MEHLIFVAFTIGCAVLLALLEVQTEGADGWAARLPTWRIDSRWSRLLMSGKPLTGYHTYLLLFVAALAHAPFGIALVDWSWRAEARVAAFIIAFWILEDFFWFVVNPEFGLEAIPPGVHLVARACLVVDRSTRLLDLHAGVRGFLLAVAQMSERRD